MQNSKVSIPEMKLRVESPDKRNAMSHLNVFNDWINHNVNIL